MDSTTPTYYDNENSNKQKAHGNKDVTDPLMHHDGLDHSDLTHTPHITCSTQGGLLHAPANSSSWLAKEEKGTSEMCIGAYT